MAQKETILLATIQFIHQADKSHTSYHSLTVLGDKGLYIAFSIAVNRTIPCAYGLAEGTGMSLGDSLTKRDRPSSSILPCRCKRGGPILP